LWRMRADLNRQRIGIMTFLAHRGPATRVSPTSVLPPAEIPQAFALIAPTPAATGVPRQHLWRRFEVVI